MPEYRFCHQCTTCGGHKCQDYASLLLILGLAGCLVIYSANSVFSAITRVNEARLHSSIEVFTTSLYKLARIYVTEFTARVGFPKHPGKLPRGVVVCMFIVGEQSLF